MELSPEDKKRISEEENVRFKVQEKLKEESEAKKKKEESENTKGCCIGCLGLIVILYIIKVIIDKLWPNFFFDFLWLIGKSIFEYKFNCRGLFESGDKTNKSSTIDLTASVSVIVMQFVIMNIDTFD